MSRLTYSSPLVALSLRQRGNFTVPNVTGVERPHAGDPLGQLPEPYLSELRQNLIDYRVLYVVYSYATPIAWVLDDETIVIPDVTYSATTSRHQGIVRKNLVPREQPVPLARATEALKQARTVLQGAVEALESAGCQFWACDGPEAPLVEMKTCRVCASVQEVKAALAQLDADWKMQ